MSDKLFEVDRTTSPLESHTITVDISPEYIHALARAEFVKLLSKTRGKRRVKLLRVWADWEESILHGAGCRKTNAETT